MFLFFALEVAIQGVAVYNQVCHASSSVNRLHDSLNPPTRVLRPKSCASGFLIPLSPERVLLVYLSNHSKWSFKPTNPRRYRAKWTSLARSPIRPFTRSWVLIPGNQTLSAVVVHPNRSYFKRPIYFSSVEVNPLIESEVRSMRWRQTTAQG